MVASLVTSAATAQTEALLAADRAAGTRSAACGFACGIGSVLAGNAYYLHNGMPIIQGGEAVRSFLLAQDTLLSQRVQWEPLEGRVSADGTFGITWGLTAVALRGGPVRFGRYVSAWRREGNAWRVAAHVQTALNAVGEAHRPSGWAPPSLDPLRTAERPSPFLEADRAFAAQGVRDGAAAAFAAWAAPDGVVFGPTELVRGPAAIREYFSGPPSQWEWGPVGAGGAVDGSLGFTVGEATIRRTLPGGGEATTRSKYLTAWVRLPDGAIRYIVDAGNNR
jgi:ketosteroid isomerase-like protein